MSSSLSESARRLGLEQTMEPSEARELTDALETLWEAEHGPVRSLERDLKTLARMFEPSASGRRVQEEIAKLGPAPASARSLRTPLVLEVGEGVVVMTPEGRVALDLLRDALLNSPSRVEFGEAALLRAEQRLTDLYRAWSRHRVLKTIELMRGESSPLRLPAVGVTLALLVNRNVGEKSAIRKNPEARGEAERVILEAAAAFAQGLGDATRLKIKKEDLYRGWMIPEVNRRLPGAITIDRKAGVVYITPSHRDQILDLLARELGRREFDAATVASAFDALVDSLRAKHDRLAAHGAAFELPPESDRLRAQLVERFQAVGTDGRN